MEHSPTAETLEPGAETSPADLDAIAAAVDSATVEWSGAPLRARALSLNAIAAALASSAEELIALAQHETGLSHTRLEGELTRTIVQLRLFADVAADGGFLDVRIDESDPDFVLGVRPDLRRFHVAAGPVLNFAASNFPFAFSVAGGDTASALAAGCGVVVKAHAAHPGLSRLTASLVAAALRDTGAPEGVFALIAGRAAGVAMLRDPRIAVATFTGSVTAGTVLARIAANRTPSIPFYGELGSVNPVFVTRAAIAERGDEIAAGYVTAVAGSAGQLCTKPGFLFLPSGHGLTHRIRRNGDAQSEHRMLYPGIAQAYDRRRQDILSTPGVDMIAEGSYRSDSEGHGWVTPTIVRVSVSDLERHHERLLEEAFGPLSIVVECDEPDHIADVARRLFSGNLTGTVHAATGEDTPSLRALVSWCASSTGRVIMNGWPTGVSVTPAMQHGGPWPATTDGRATSVGTASLARFLRPVAYQNVPAALLPAPLADRNAWSVPQSVNRAWSSQTWGSLYAIDTKQTRTTERA